MEMPPLQFQKTWSLILLLYHPSLPRLGFCISIELFLTISSGNVTMSLSGRIPSH